MPGYTWEEIDALTDRGAMMTSRQFSALGQRLSEEKLVRELPLLQSSKRMRACARLSSDDITGWLRNGWNTEKLLRISRDMFTGRERAYALQWAFPQAYYSAYAVTMAFFLTRGHTEATHASVIKRVGLMMKSGEYPGSISFLATGGMRRLRFHNIEKHPTRSTLAYDPEDEDSVETQIAQFLSGTRSEDLKRKKQDMKFRTARGKPKKNLNADEWGRVSAKLGPTSLLSLLYRKRIKANYGEIDTYLSNQLEADAVFRSLALAVGCLNLVHEFFIFRALGEESFDALMRETQASSYEAVSARRKRLAECD